MADRDPLPHDPAQVRAELQGKIRDLLDRLGFSKYPIVALDTSGRGIVPLNPRRNDRHPGSFVIWTDGDGAGAWKDYAIERKGDVFDLIEYIERLDRWIDAYWWALDWLGWGRGQVRSAGQDKLDRERREAESKQAETRAVADVEARAKKARGFWLACAKEIRGTPAWTYLTVARGLPMERLGRVPGALRFHPALEHTDQATGEVTEWPALVSAMSHWESAELRAVHRTWLQPDGMGKAPVAKPKMMLGPAKGCAIRLWKGAGELTPEAAAKKGVLAPLILQEGIEDGLTAAIARPEYRVWAAGSLAGMGGLGWPACASGVVLGQDNDWHEAQALAGFEKVQAHWRAMAAGRPVKAVASQVGKDINDWAREGRGAG